MPYGEEGTRFRMIRSTLPRHQGFQEYNKDYISCVISGFILHLLFHIHWYSKGKYCTMTSLCNMTQSQSCVNHLLDLNIQIMPWLGAARRTQIFPQ